MKELYIAPQLKVLCLAPAEQLAQLSQDFDSYLGGENSGNVSGAIMDFDDIDLILP